MSWALTTSTPAWLNPTSMPPAPEKSESPDKSVLFFMYAILAYLPFQIKI
jgi:hypothetical protein